jgi:transcriptional regulator with XRE-family HTH domain
MIRIAQPEHLGHALAQMRAMNRLNRRQVATAAGVQESQYGRYETGEHVPALTTLLRLLAVYGYDLALIPQEDA